MGFRAGRQNLLRETGQPLAPTDWDVFDAKPTETGQPLAPTDWAQRYFGLVEVDWDHTPDKGCWRGACEVNSLPTDYLPSCTLPDTGPF